MTLSPAARIRRGRVRSIVASILVLSWLVALVGLVRRDVLLSVAERRAELALRVNPGTFYYAVERDGRHIGFASSAIDTLKDTTLTFLTVRDAMLYELPSGDTTVRATIQSDVALRRDFAVLTFGSAIMTDQERAIIIGWSESDSSFAYSVSRGGAPPDTMRAAIAPYTLVPPLMPLVTVLGERPRVGNRATHQVFDPEAGTSRAVTAEITAESLFVVSDSARLDAASGRWVPALRDTVRAWMVVSDASPAFTGWLDAQGRVVETTHPGGLTLRRMAYELAFENWRTAPGATAR